MRLTLLFFVIVVFYSCGKVEKLKSLQDELISSSWKIMNCKSNYYGTYSISQYYNGSYYNTKEYDHAGGVFKELGDLTFTNNALGVLNYKGFNYNFFWSLNDSLFSMKFTEPFDPYQPNPVILYNNYGTGLGNGSNDYQNLNVDEFYYEKMSDLLFMTSKGLSDVGNLTFYLVKN